MIQSISSGKITKTNNYADIKSKSAAQISFTGINASKIGKEITRDTGSKLGKKVVRFAEESADSIKGIFRKIKGQDELPFTEKPKILPVKNPYTTHVHDKCVRWNSKHPGDAVSVPSAGCDISVAQAAETALNSKIRKIDPSFTRKEHDIQEQIRKIENNPWMSPEEKVEEIAEIKARFDHYDPVFKGQDYASQKGVEEVQNNPWMSPEEKIEEINKLKGIHNETIDVPKANHGDKANGNHDETPPPQSSTEPEHKSLLHKLWDSIFGDDIDHPHNGEDIDF